MVLPIIALAAGVGALGYWSTVDHAKDMQAEITASATETVGNSLHGIQTTVSGRDIIATGIAHNAAERDAILAKLGEIDGRRIVRDEIELLPVAQDYSIRATKSADGLSVEGVMPTQTGIDALDDAIGTEGLTLASGEPDMRWRDAVQSGVGALSTLDQGTLEMSGQTMKLTGIAADQATRDALEGLELPEGYSLDNSDVAVPVPPTTDLLVSVDANETVSVSGTGPTAMSSDDIIKALGVETAEVNVEGVETDANKATAQLETVKDWLGEFEIAEITVTEDGITIDGETKSDVNADLLADVLSNDDSFKTVMLRPTTRQFDNGFTRRDVVSGDVMEFTNGYWIPVSTFDVSEANCTTNLDGLVKRQSVTYLPGDATLSPRARRAVNALAGLFRRCLTDDSIIVQIHGHTDAEGEDDYNLDLSKTRAASVATALNARGISADLMLSEGFGESKPIATNDTEEGRALNRRTEITLVRR